MSFCIDLARAYRRTGDEKYARAFAQQLSDWLAGDFVSAGLCGVFAGELFGLTVRPGV